MEVAGVASVCLMVSPAWRWWGMAGAFTFLVGANRFWRWWVARAGAQPDGEEPTRRDVWPIRRILMVALPLALGIAVTLLIVPVRRCTWLDAAPASAEQDVARVRQIVELFGPESDCPPHEQAMLRAMLLAGEYGSVEPMVSVEVS